MQEYAIMKNEKWITGNIQKGCYEWTANRERRYTFEDINKAIAISKEHEGSEVIGEHSHLTVYPQSDELCAWCQCSLSYGHVEHMGALFCSESCYQDATGEGMIMPSKNVTKTSQDTQVLKYGYQWVETTETGTIAGITTKRITKTIERNPKVGFFRKLLRM